jgi:hypothetical protein
MRINIKMILFILFAGFALNVVNCNIMAGELRSPRPQPPTGSGSPTRLQTNRVGSYNTNTKNLPKGPTRLPIIPRSTRPNKNAASYGGGRYKSYSGGKYTNMHRDRGWPYPGRHFIGEYRARHFHHGLSIGAIISVLPFGFETIIFGQGIVYYYLDGVYYEPVPEGYIVVPESELEGYYISGEEYVVNIPNSDGSFTPIKLKKSDNGYIGPQGEFYQGHPSIEQLKVLYGK